MKKTTLLYKPKGKAGEYSSWACNLYNGCSNKCEYCYNRMGSRKELLGNDNVSIKKSLESNIIAFDYFKKELFLKEQEILNSGGEIFFNFVSDPCLKETRELNFKCIHYCITHTNINCRICTKKTDWINDFINYFNSLDSMMKNIYKISLMSKKDKELSNYFIYIVENSSLQKVIEKAYKTGIGSALFSGPFMKSKELEQGELYIKITLIF